MSPTSHTADVDLILQFFQDLYLVTDATASAILCSRSGMCVAMVVKTCNPITGSGMMSDPATWGPGTQHSIFFGSMSHPSLWQCVVQESSYFSVKVRSSAILVEDETNCRILTKLRHDSFNHHTCNCFHVHFSLWNCTKHADFWGVLFMLTDLMMTFWAPDMNAAAFYFAA
jgi:hypothetical protein